MKINKKASCLKSRFKRKSLLIQNTRAQHEIVGFILIVVIVVIIGMFLLIFYLREKPIEKQSLDIQNFLQATMAYTTQCAINYVPEYESIEDLIKSCYKNENQQCLDGKQACKVLNGELTELISKSWNLELGSKNNGYSIFIYYEQILNEDSENEEDIQKDEILRLSEGNCTGSKVGAEYLIADYPGNIVVDMEICYKTS